MYMDLYASLDVYVCNYGGCGNVFWDCGWGGRFEGLGNMYIHKDDDLVIE